MTAPEAGPPAPPDGTKVGANVIDTLLLGAGGRRRQVQDLPVLGDVWVRFADMPGKPHDLLITPTWEEPAATVARLVARTGLNDGENTPYSRGVAYLQDVVVAWLTLTDLAGVAIPLTKWWDDIASAWESPSDAKLQRWIEAELEDVIEDEEPDSVLPLRNMRGTSEMLTEERQVAKLGLMLGVLGAAATRTGENSGSQRSEARQASHPGVGSAEPLSTVVGALEALGRPEILGQGVSAVRLIIDRYGAVPDAGRGVIFQVSLNRTASPATADSVAAIKADAALSLFSISCKDVSWAILDSGIDQTHPAFWDYERIWKDQESAPTSSSEKTSEAAEAAPPHRIKATFDFRHIRTIMSAGPPDSEIIDAIRSQTGLDRKAINKALRELAADRETGARINWAKVRPLIERDRPAAPPVPHGTHVAGILGACWPQGTGKVPKRTDPVKMAGVCPDVTLYDFRVLGSNDGDSEFAVIAALQFIRFLNDQSGYSVIHGVNMSLSIPHNVRNYACGRTPVCVESEALVASGVVVVAAAGNRGFQQYLLADNTMFESYAASSITDPGNAEGVITVGSTHRLWPHTYGVSFFSSRGPTGDGRMKPDLLAPGEKIESCIPGDRSDRMDGTSMAAPHVSGAAAMLMARHPELKGQPTRIKQVLCDTATDLNRERSFQGHGMVDVLRAIQSV